jgi:hypothetical protein
VPTSIPPETLTTFVKGFDGAYARLRPLIGDVNVPTEEAFIPLFEALHWTVALSEVADAQKNPALEGVKSDFLALRFARNRAHHQWANALETADIALPPRPIVVLASRRGGGVRQRGPTSARAWVWVDADRLPPGTNKRGKHEYVTQLQGLQAHAVLDRVSAALDSLR